MSKTYAAVICMALSILAFYPRQATAKPITVTTERIVLNPEAPNQTQIGSLIYRGGLVLTSDEGRFGGFSALGISTDGRRLVSLSDRGHRLSARIIYDDAGNLTGLTGTDLLSLAGLDGRVLPSKKQADIESMAPGVDGEIIVSFERNHRLWRYLPGQSTPEILVPPDGLGRLKKNSGIEALTLLDDGRLLALTEGAEGAQNTIGWVSDPDGWSQLTYKLADGYRVTGAATHPDGDVFVLERYYTLRKGVSVRIRRIEGSSVHPDSELHGALITELRSPLHVDNFEGIDLRKSSDNRIFIYLISDDNFNPLQSTLLMMFEVTQQ